MRSTALTVGLPGALAVAPADAGRPTFDPDNFVKRVDNRWFPLEAGTIWRYRGEEDGQAKKQ